ncbi:MAG TPA: insulinase family protein, partial [Candidatus Krumholzibacterium sp.]|nr:insulinase family protein [Candidatus Krumholzibacterium sp.]
MNRGTISIICLLVAAMMPAVPVLVSAAPAGMPAALAMMPAAPAAGGREMTLSGGPQLVLQHYPESKVFCIAVSVEAGSALESPEMRGVTHLLEHLCFDGTERFSREQISSWVDERGAFLNAFTRKETTVYFLLAGREYLEEGIELLSQMLLHSVFPEDELAKERKVVLEEIGHSIDSPGQERSMFVDRYLYRGSDLTEPVIGYPATIESMSRESIAAYYHERYRPGRMKVLLMGGFDPGSAAGWIGDYFSGPGKSGQGSLSGGVPRWSCEITRRTSEDMAAGIDLLVPVPGVGEGDFGAVLLLEELLHSGRNPLSVALAGAGLPDAETSLEVHAGFSALRFHVDAVSGDGEGLYALPAMIGSLADWRP